MNPNLDRFPFSLYRENYDAEKWRNAEEGRADMKREEEWLRKSLERDDQPKDVQDK